MPRHHHLLVTRGRDRVERLAEEADLLDARRNGDDHGLVTRGRDCLDAAGTGAARDAVVEIRRRPELGLHRRAADQLTAHRENTDDRRVARVAAAGARLLLRVRVPRVQVERERRRPRVRRDRDDDALLRIAAGGHVAERSTALHATTEQRRTLDVGRGLRQRRRRNGLLLRRRPPPLCLEARRNGDRHEQRDRGHRNSSHTSQYNQQRRALLPFGMALTKFPSRIVCLTEETTETLYLL